MNEGRPSASNDTNGTRDVSPSVPTTLGEALPKEMARIRDVVMPVYYDIGPAGSFALAMMKTDLDRAARAMAEGDLPAMISAYQALKDYKL